MDPLRLVSSGRPSENPAIITADTTFSEEALLKRAGHVASRLREVAMSGDRVIVSLKNTPDFYAGLVGCWVAGVVPVLLDPMLKRELLRAVEMTRAMAADYDVDLGLPPGQQKPGGWPRWITVTHALLRAHLENRLWRFEDGHPCEWRKEAGRWTHPRFDAVLTLAPDALEQQLDEAAIFEFDDPVEPLRVAVPGVELQFLLAEGQGGPTVTSDLGSETAPDARIGSGATIRTVAPAGSSLVTNTSPGSRPWRKSDWWAPGVVGKFVEWVVPAR